MQTKDEECEAEDPITFEWPIVAVAGERVQLAGVKLAILNILVKLTKIKRVIANINKKLPG